MCFFFPPAVDEAIDFFGVPGSCLGMESKDIKGQPGHLQNNALYFIGFRSQSMYTSCKTV